MFQYGGNNSFGERFDFFEWSAPYYESPEEVYKALRDLNLEGKTLIALHAIGCCAHIGEPGDCRLYDIISAAGVELGDLWWETYENIDNVLVPWSVSLYEPLQFVFDDNTTLEILPIERGGRELASTAFPAVLSTD